MNGTDLRAVLGRLEDAGVTATLSGDAATVVADVYHDHRQVQPGGLFCCVAGANADGHDHAPAAVAAGAAAVLGARRLELDVPQIIVDDVRRAMGPVAALVHGDPGAALRCVGVTGTNGKTTTAALIVDILVKAGRKPQVVGTLTGVRTTPEATDLQRILAGFRDDGFTDVVMEVSSHALVLHRVGGLRFAVSVFTNLSQDHLDFHGTMEEYFRAKAKLFEPGLSDRGVVDVDDAHGRLLGDAAQIPIVGFGLADAEPIRALAPASFTWRGRSVRLPLAGRFNVANALAAATATSELGIDDDTIVAALHEARTVPGRFEMIRMGQNFTVIVDYAHTPDALEKLLVAAREIAGDRRVLVTFGAGGDRDPAKRPLMGEAADAADLVVLTNDNPRSEPPDQIAAEIRAGSANPERFVVELDRRAAIARVLGAADDGDVVLIAGKGHETTQTIGAEVTAFDDRVVAAEVLAELGFVP